MLLAIDIGNTNIVIGCIENDNIFSALLYLQGSHVADTRTEA